MPTDPIEPGKNFPALPAEQRADYVAGVLRLALFYAWHKCRDGVALDEILNRRVHLYRLTVLWDGRLTPAGPGFPWETSSWGAVLRDLEGLCRRQRSAAAFEEAAFARLWPLAEPAVPRDVARWPWIPEGYCPTPLPNEQVCGCFAWEPGRTPDSISIHIANACMPASPFADLRQRARELTALVESARAATPAARTLGCNSWLNTFPPFLKLFPDDWVRPGRPGEPGSGANWWGQFMARDGSFHRRHGNALRATLDFPWPAVDGFCSLDRLADHLGRL